MKKFVIMLAVLPLATAALAAGPTGNPTVQWRGMAGVITAQGVDNPVSANISSGTFAWTARSGQAQADLHNGAIDFSVDGLVINGTQFSGTPGPVTAVTGTLVCSPGTADEAAAISASEYRPASRMCRRRVRNCTADAVTRW